MAAGELARVGGVSGGDWGGYNKSLDGQRFSLLEQINVENAATLRESCHVEIARHGSFQAGPLVVKGTMYVTVEDDTVALDPVTCAIRWRHSYTSEEANLIPVNRGVAYLNGRIFRGTRDARVVALDAATGQELWTSVAGDGRLGEFISSAPVAWNGLVFVGIAGSEFGIGGRIFAFDAANGREVWRFNLVPTGKEPGAETWKGGAWAAHGGGGTWSSYALDQVAEEIFIPVGNPVPDFSPDDRPGANLFTDSVVVLDARTGALKWWYQVTPHDSHDWDLGAAPLLFRNTRSQDKVAVAGKDGYLYVIDRTTHDLTFRVPTTTVDAVPALPTAAGVKVCPGAAGGTEWNGPAFDPAQKTIFVGSVDMCTVYSSKPGQTYGTAKVLYGGAWQWTAEPPTGWITAFDADSGKVRWKYHADAPVIGALTPTAGGIVMGGDNAGDFLVFDSTTGKLLEKIATHGSIAGGIVTYEVNGRQYVAFTSGNTSRAFGAVGRPSIVVMQTAAPPKLSGTAAADAARGAAVYNRVCVSCHASDGKGIRGVDIKSIKGRMNRDQLVAWIRNPVLPMPKVFPEPLDADDIRDIEAVAAYLEQQ
jgi:alcohol dehydrogenase (cytochrome c)